MLLFYSMGNRALSEDLVLAAPAAGPSANWLDAALRGGALFLVFLLLAACGGGGGTGGGVGSGDDPVVLRSMVITPANPTLKAGASLNLTATGNYSDGTTRVLSGSANWTSSATRVATVAPGGVVSAVAAGSTTITATSGGIAASTTVTVKSQATVTYLHIFGVEPSDGAQPNGPLLHASDGNFYGTTRAGGANRCFDQDEFCGAIFRLTPGGAETVVYSFGASVSDGVRPTGPLIQGKDGALYGMTTSGGAYGWGTVFKITLGGDYTVLHSFGASSLDGNRPLGSLLEASDGNFYGTTVGGGSSDCSRSGGECGTVFRISPNGEHTVLYYFGSSPWDGAIPNGSLIEGDDGSFYGTTSTGGDLTCSPFPKIKGCGTVFKMTPAGEVTILHSFGAAPSDGILPQGPLIRGGDGAFYGTTYLGGGGRCSTTPGCGTVFRITPAGTVTILYAFAQPSSDGTNLNAEGYNPAPFLIRTRDGNFYGVTESTLGASTVRTGTVFRLTPSGVKTTLHAFGPLMEAPSTPVGGLVETTNGVFYGITAENGELGAVGDRPGFGTAFKLVVQ